MCKGAAHDDNTSKNEIQCWDPFQHIALRASFRAIGDLADYICWRRAIIQD